MKDELTIKDLYLLIKNNIKVLSVSIVATVMLASLYVVISNINSDDANQESVEEQQLGSISEETFEELANMPVEYMNDREITSMQEYLEESAYRFMFFVENENGEPIGNLNMMRAIFRHESLVEQVEEIIGEELTPDPVLSVNIVSYADSGLFELQLARDTHEASEELANAYYQIVSEGEISVLNQFEISMFEDAPIPLNDFIEEDEESLETSPERRYREWIRDGILYGLAGLVIGTFIGLSIIALKVLFTRNITELYNYEESFNDRIVRLNHLKQVNEEKIISQAYKNILYPVGSNKVILIQKNIESKLAQETLGKLQEGAQQIVVLNDMSEIESSTKVDEVIILTAVNETFKEWYKDQRLQLKGYDFPVKVIQFN